MRSTFKHMVRQASPAWADPIVPSLTSSRKPVIYAGRGSTEQQSFWMRQAPPDINSSSKSTHGFPPEVTFRSFRCHTPPPPTPLSVYRPTTTSRPGPAFGMARGRIPLLAKVRRVRSSPKTDYDGRHRLLTRLPSGSPRAALPTNTLSTPASPRLSTYRRPLDAARKTGICDKPKRSQWR
jgi:hypothetical protein